MEDNKLPYRFSDVRASQLEELYDYEIDGALLLESYFRTEVECGPFERGEAYQVAFVEGWLQNARSTNGNEPLSFNEHLELAFLAFKTYKAFQS